MNRLRAYWAAHLRLISALIAVLVVTGWTLFLLFDQQVGGFVLIAAIFLMCPFMSSGSGGIDSQPEGPMGKSDLGSGPVL